MATENRNEYLDQVMERQERLEADLRQSRKSLSPSAAPAQAKRARAMADMPAEHVAPNAVEVRITGVGRWKTVIVPPNAFVVHTRRGRPEPLHVGLGTSFRYNPHTDSFLVVPGAMQTILINAFSICRELQGVLVQAYVQWIIEDFAIAYRRLDFGDPADPMRLVNLQLKEQAEAAIKDKVATLGVLEVLSDKQPIIEELTARLRAVAEGEGQRDQGLGLRIVTVQIKEAVVSSSTLWNNLQKPYRSEQARIARLAELTAEAAVTERELATARAKQTQQMEHEREVTELRDRNAASQFDRETGERVRRAERQEEDSRRLADLANETATHALALERERHAEELEIGRLRLQREAELRGLAIDAELTEAGVRAQSAHDTALLDVERERLRAEIANGQTPVSLQARMVDSLPEIVGKLPKPTEVRSVTIGGTDGTSLAGLLAQLTAVVDALRSGSHSSPPPVEGR